MTVSHSDAAALSSFEHRRDYADDAGRDRWTVRAVDAWIRSVLPPILAPSVSPGSVLDVGCAEQPFRALIESNGQRYVGMDVVQNRTRSVDIVSTLEDAPFPAQAFHVILCTEVLEHVVDIDAAFAGLRRLAANHAFSVEAAAPLGEVLATLIAGASILPVSRSPIAKAKVGLLRLAAAAPVRVLDARSLSNGSAINFSCYLSNGVVLRAV